MLEFEKVGNNDILKTRNFVIITHITRTGRKQFSWQTSERWGERLANEELTRELLKGNAVFIKEDNRIFIPAEELKFNNDLFKTEWVLVEWNKNKGVDPKNPSIILMGNIDTETFERRF